jgi:hypothetical protein
LYDHHFAGLNRSTEYSSDCVILALKHARAAGKLQNALVDPSGLHDASILGKVTVQHREAAILAERMDRFPNRTVLPIKIDFLESLLLAEGNRRRYTAGGCAIELIDRLAARACSDHLHA